MALQSEAVPTCVGIDTDIVLPIPSCPAALLPQQYSVPSRSAQVRLMPVLTAFQLVAVVIWTGLGRGVVVPSPSCPSVFAPQQ